MLVRMLASSERLSSCIDLRSCLRYSLKEILDKEKENCKMFKSFLRACEYYSSEILLTQLIFLLIRMVRSDLHDKMFKSMASKYQK